ncbi:reverse transcriptase [Alphaentomopoxvirus acuprea]|uniref:Reverse transcriptase n=1 Tax=Alphaentomopoxvirus acuprea TaxID=62099 RepID=W6JIV1_9POXV|nr:reverse transcriptase [Anomala cuprea entomopoxvirus]BAO49513.1 reverse transcriptase [Anomala cuprea entomopoxvirus]
MKMDISGIHIESIDFNLSLYINKLYRKQNRLIFVLDNSLKRILKEFRNEYLIKFTTYNYNDLIIRIKNLINDNYFVIVTDIKNAYFSVDRTKLYTILQNITEIDEDSIEFLKCYYKTFSFVDRNSYYTISNGLITGCPLSSLLFNIYLTHSLSEFNNNVLIYHDDIIIYSDTYNDIMQLYTNIICKLKEYKLEINLNKTHFIHNSDYNEFSCEPVTILNFTLYPMNNYKTELILCLIQYMKCKHNKEKYFKHKDLWDKQTLKLYHETIDSFKNGI